MSDQRSPLVSDPDPTSGTPHDHHTRISTRVSDAIALALHLGVPIHAEDIVLDTAAVADTAIRAEGDDRAPDEVEQFRRFLDTASPEDFDPD
jgi:bifunctional DNase/RNase